MLITFNWRWHTQHEFGLRRVWLEGWGFDQFELLTEVEFDALCKMGERFGFLFVEHTD